MSNIRDSFNQGAGLKKSAKKKPKATPDKRKYKERTAADPKAPERAGKCPKGYVMKNGKCVKYNPFNDGRTPTSASQTTGP